MKETLSLVSVGVKRIGMRQGIYAAPASPKGCICPPTSESTCRRSDCGRRDLSAIPGDHNSVSEKRGSADDAIEFVVSQEGHGVSVETGFYFLVNWISGEEALDQLYPMYLAWLTERRGHG